MQAIVYTSYAGHTKGYAELLGEQLALPVYDLKTANAKLAGGAEVIYLGWLMAGGVKGYKEAARKYSIKAVCAVGMARGDGQLTEIRKKNSLPGDMPVFCLQGGFELDRLHGLYRFMMKTMQATFAKKLAAKPQLSPEEKEMLDMMKNGKNAVSIEKLAEVIAWCKGKEA